MCRPQARLQHSHVFDSQTDWRTERSVCNRKTSKQLHIFADKIYLMICAERAANHFGFRKRIHFSRKYAQKRLIHLRCQWPWPLNFWPQFCSPVTHVQGYVSTKSEVSMALQFQVNRRYRMDRRTGCNALYVFLPRGLYKSVSQPASQPASQSVNQSINHRGITWPKYLNTTTRSMNRD